MTHHLYQPAPYTLRHCTKTQPLNVALLAKPCTLAYFLGQFMASLTTVRVRYQTIEIDNTDIRICTLRDNQQF